MSRAGRTTTLLNGTWQLQPTNDEAVPPQWDHTVPVPALVDGAEPRHEWKKFHYHWHRKTFNVPDQSELTFIVIEQAMFGTDVWLNGKHLGGDIACYTSQEYDARAALRAGENELIIRVGQREHLPPHSAVGKDQERTEWIPGIWGDVYLLQSGNPRIKLVQVVPHIETATAEVRITVENLSAHTVKARLTTRVAEKHSGAAAGGDQQQQVSLQPNSSTAIIVHHQIDGMKLWSPESPFLYVLHAVLASRTSDPESAGDSCAVVFGMREFTIIGRHFHLNGRKILLRGGNIAFHRFLSDADRGTLPWNLDWVKKLLIDIPKTHNFNFFRNHIGQMYNRWYDIADENGMLLQNEWMFWTTSGTKEQITKEFTRWLQDNWNHPSIVIWDALNECSDDIVQKEIVPAMKQLDQTRPWESVDVVEEHPYIYSLGPVMNDRKFGFTRSLAEIEHSARPTMLNEFCWWWLDKDFRPSLLTRDVVERWLGPHWTQEQLMTHQSVLVTELVELFRRMRVDAIQPFVYLSNNAGPTAHWFVGDIKNLQPKPVLAALKNAFASPGVSIELWDRHFCVNEHRAIRVFVFNDTASEVICIIRCGIVHQNGAWLAGENRRVRVGPVGDTVVQFDLMFPAVTGTMRVRAEVTAPDGSRSAVSEKIAHVFGTLETPPGLHEGAVAVLEPGDETTRFLAGQGVRTMILANGNLAACNTLMVVRESLRSPTYQSRLGAITTFLESGKTVVVIEPEYETDTEEEVCVALGVELKMRKRKDIDKGGYDSYLFADDVSHPLWQGLHPEHLKMFNGGYGGEVVSQHDVTATRETTVLARCGMHLAVPAVFEIPCGKGRILVSRLQLGGRLLQDESSGNLYDRRVDPVLQRFVLNLVSYAARGERRPFDVVPAPASLKS